MPKLTIFLLLVIAIFLGTLIVLNYSPNITDKKISPLTIPSTTTPVDNNSNQGSSNTSTSTIQPEDPNIANLASYPDLPISTLPTEPISVKFLVEHRTTFNGNPVIVQGKVVNTLLGEKACPPNAGMCAQPSIFLADSTKSNRNPLYDLRIVVSESEQEKDYPISKTIEIPITVEGSKVAVMGRKVY